MQITPNNTPASTPFVPYTPGKASPGGASIGGGVGASTPEDDKVNTPGKMFTQTPPASKRLDADGRPILVNRTSSRRRRSGTSPVAQLPAIPAKGSYSYGATNPVMTSNIRYADTSNSLKELLMRSSAIAKERTQARTRQHAGAFAQNPPPAGEERSGSEREGEGQIDEDIDRDQPSEAESVGSRAPSGKPTRTPRRGKPVSAEELEAAAKRRQSLRGRSASAQPEENINAKGKSNRGGTRLNAGTVPEESEPPRSRPGSVTADRAQTIPRLGAQEEEALGDAWVKKPASFAEEEKEDRDEEPLQQQGIEDESSYIPGDDTLADASFNSEGGVSKAFSTVGERASLVKRLWFAVRRGWIYVKLMVEPVKNVILVLLAMTVVTGFLVGRFPFPIPSWLPIPTPPAWGRYPGGTDFLAPGQAPESFEALVGRLSRVEKVLEVVAGQQRVLSQNYEDVSVYTEEIQSYTKTLSEEGAMATSQINLLGKKYQEVKTMLEKNVESMMEMRHNNEDRSRTIDHKVNTHDKVLQNLKSELDAIQPKIDALMNNNRRLNEALNSLSSSLPESIPVRTGPNGEMIIRPEFYQHLRDFFRSEYSSISQPDGSNKGSDGKKRTPDVDNRPYRWAEFLKQNEANLRTYIGESQSKWWEGALKDQTVISRKEFLSLLKAKVEELDRVLTEKNKKHITSEVGSKVASMTRNLEKELMKGGKGKNIGENLADSLYQHYSSKLIDYASYAAGTFIDPYQTSPTYDRAPTNTIYRTLRFILGREHQIPRAKTAITPTTLEAGICWPIPGRNGTLGLLLPQKIYTTDITVEHIPYSTSPFKDTAPKNIELWVKIEDPKLLESMYEAAQVALGSDIKANMPDPSKPYFDKYVRVASFTYDFSLGASPIQTFSVPLNLKQMGASSDKVVLSVTDNYGNEEFTCIYRFRVHGEPGEDAKDSRMIEGLRRDLYS